MCIYIYMYTHILYVYIYIYIIEREGHIPIYTHIYIYIYCIYIYIYIWYTYNYGAPESHPGRSRAQVRAKDRTPDLTNNQQLFEDATKDPLKYSIEHPLDKWQSFGTYHWHAKLHWTMPLNIHWNMPLKIHVDFWGVDFWCAIHPVSVRRFPSFRTQPLESLSHYIWTNIFLCNPAPGENLLSGNLVMETRCSFPRTGEGRGASRWHHKVGCNRVQ